MDSFSSNHNPGTKAVSHNSKGLVVDMAADTGVGYIKGGTLSSSHTLMGKLAWFLNNSSNLAVEVHQMLAAEAEENFSQVNNINSNINNSRIFSNNLSSSISKGRT